MSALESPAQRLLGKLEGVRQRGSGRWTARCPAHGDRNASLAITELADGRVLIRCFAECGAHEIVEAAGLTLADLFPRSPSSDHYRRTERRAFDASQRLACIAFEADVAAMILRRVAEKGDVSEQDRARLMRAAERIAGAVPR